MDKATFELMQLPYAADALEPVISAATIGFHHGKHLQAYVGNLNTLIAGTPFEGMELVDIVCKSEGGILNNAGQILNHEKYFAQFTAPKADNRPEGKLAEAASSRKQVPRCSVRVGYGSRPIKTANSSSHRKRMQPTPYSAD